MFNAIKQHGLLGAAARCVGSVARTVRELPNQVAAGYNEAGTSSDTPQSDSDGASEDQVQESTQEERTQETASEEPQTAQG